MKRLFGFLFLVMVGFSAVGCGDKTYDIPEVDKAESEKNEEEINKMMEAEMEKQMGGGKK